MDREGFRNRLKQYKKAREENPGLKYYDFMERLAEFKAKEWNDDPDMILTHMLNDNSYNYRQMYEDNPNFEIKTGHFKDTYKTVYHPTFSNESIYSGDKSEYNPRGTIGGRWVYDKISERNEYRPSYSQIVNDDFDYATTSRYIENSSDFIDDYYKNIKERAKNIDNFSNYAVLNTYYPFISSVPYTGHSSLSVTGLVPNPQGDAVIGTIGIDKGGHNEDYNLITNNCSDATRCGLEHTFDKKINPFLFTTPGDVQDFALDELNAIHGKKGDQYFNPKTGTYQTRRISDAEKKANRGKSTVYIPINKEQRDKLIDFIHKGDKEQKFADGGIISTYDEGGEVTDEGGWTESYWSRKNREAAHKDLDPTMRFSPETLLFDNGATGEENEYWKAYLGLDNTVPKMNKNAYTEWDMQIEAEKKKNGELLSDFYGTTPNMDLSLQAVADTLYLGKLSREYDMYSKTYEDLPSKKEIDSLYKQSKQVMDNPGKWQQMYSDENIIKRTSDKDHGEINPLGMLAHYGMKWVPEENALYVHDTYDFPWYARWAGKIKERPKEMKIRSKIEFNPKKGSKLLRSAENYNNAYK